MAAQKQFTIIIDRRGTERTTSGTIPELVEYFKYTLETGASYQREKGNSKINTNPKSIGALVKNLNAAKHNAAANGCPDTFYRQG